MESLRPFYRDTWAEVDLDAIAHNIHAIKSTLPEHVHIMAVVKANAYGHGAADVARESLAAGASILGVAILDEAIALRQEGIVAPILVMGYVRPEDVKIACELNITLTVFQAEWATLALQTLQDSTLKLHCHLKLDTGMNRIGMKTEEEIDELLAVLETTKKIIVDGAYTHLAKADEHDKQYTFKQIDRFNQLLDHLRIKGIDPFFKHCANSAGTLQYEQAPFNVIRAGIAMYGLTPSIEMKPTLPVKLKQAFSLHSKVTHVKRLGPGEKVSYGGTYETKQEEWIITIPIGYADGFIRANQSGEVLVNGDRAPIVGRVCMDQLMVRVKEEVPVGTKVTLIGAQGDSHISTDEVAERLETINYEVSCIISYRVPRAIVKDGKTLHIHNRVFS
nr:alanine racemase [Paenalkalicoccus suaedae]